MLVTTNIGSMTLEEVFYAAAKGNRYAIDFVEGMEAIVYTNQV